MLCALQQPTTHPTLVTHPYSRHTSVLHALSRLEGGGHPTRTLVTHPYSAHSKFPLRLLWCSTPSRGETSAPGHSTRILARDTVGYAYSPHGWLSRRPHRRGEEQRGDIIIRGDADILLFRIFFLVENSPLQPPDLRLLFLLGGVGVGLGYARDTNKVKKKDTTRIRKKIRARIPGNRLAHPQSLWDNKPFSPKPWGVPSSFHPFSYPSPSSLATSSTDASH